MFSYKNNLDLKDLDQGFSVLSEKLATLTLPKGFLDFALYALSELFANTQEHSQSKQVLVEIKIDNKKSFLLQVADNGIGLRQSYILKNIYPKDDSAAIEFALSGLSTKDPRERGFGLYSIRKLVKELNGEMVIESGSARAVIRRDSIAFSDSTSPTKGTAIELKAKVHDIDFYNVIK